MSDKLMYIPNDDTKNSFCTLKLMVETFEHSTYKSTNHNSLKSPKMLSQRKRKLYYKTLGTSVINSSLSPLSMEKYWSPTFSIS